HHEAHPGGRGAPRSKGCRGGPVSSVVQRRAKTGEAPQGAPARPGPSNEAPPDLHTTTPPMPSPKPPGPRPPPALSASSPVRVLHVLSELYPLVKTGGLADVGGALTLALRDQGVDVHVLLPGYPAVLRALGKGRVLFTDANFFGGGPARILCGEL